jgi:hypothetical protein
VGAAGAGVAVLRSWTSTSWRDAWGRALEVVTHRGTSPAMRNGLAAHIAMRRALLRLGRVLVRNRKVTTGHSLRHVRT